MKFRQFLLPGVNFVSGEWDFMCLACNVKRTHRMQGPDEVGGVNVTFWAF